MPGGPLCVIGPLSAIRITSVFSAMPRVFNSAIKLPIQASSRANASCRNPPLAVTRFGKPRKEVATGQ